MNTTEVVFHNCEDQFYIIRFFNCSAHILFPCIHSHYDISCCPSPLALFVLHQGTVALSRGSNISLAGCSMRLKVEAGCGNTRHFIGEMREKNRKARPGYAPFRRRDRG